MPPNERLFHARPKLPGGDDQTFGCAHGAGPSNFRCALWTGKPLALSCPRGGLLLVWTVLVGLQWIFSRRTTARPGRGSAVFKSKRSPLTRGTELVYTGNLIRLRQGRPPSGSPVHFRATDQAVFVTITRRRAGSREKRMQGTEAFLLATAGLAVGVFFFARARQRSVGPQAAARRRSEVESAARRSEGCSAKATPSGWLFPRRRSD